MAQVSCECPSERPQRSTLPLAIPMNECLFVTVAHPRAAVPVSASFGQIQPVRTAPMVVVQAIGVGSQQRTVFRQAGQAVLRVSARSLTP
jgi:hypothetical protein